MGTLCAQAIRLQPTHRGEIPGRTPAWQNDRAATAPTPDYVGLALSRVGGFTLPAALCERKDQALGQLAPSALAAPDDAVEGRPRFVRRPTIVARGRYSSSATRCPIAEEV
jgi:hypothetical protein